MTDKMISPDGRFEWDGTGWRARQLSPDGRMVWDGTSWAPLPAPQTAPMATFTANTPKPFHKTTGGKVILGFVAVLVVLGVIGALTEDPAPEEPANEARETPASTPQAPEESPVVNEEPVTPSPTTEPEPAEPTEPKEQTAFMEAVRDGQSVAEDGTEIQIVNARKARGEQFCKILPANLSVRNWIATVEEVSTELGGDDGVLVIDMGSDTDVKTWNNEASDIGSNTLISPDSKLYGQLAEISPGDEVRFSGRFIESDDCVYEASLFDENGLLTPGFIFRFSSVARVD